MVDSQSTEKVRTWIDEAVSLGAKIICGGKIKDGVLLPTILTNVNPTMKVCVNEVFAPLVTIAKYSDFKAPLRK